MSMTVDARPLTSTLGVTPCSVRMSDARLRDSTDLVLVAITVVGDARDA
jgi:hypothetical protein